MLFGEIFVIRFDVDLAWRWSGLSTACGSTGTVTCTTRLKTPRPGREQRPSTRSSVRSSTSSPTRLERSHRSCLHCNAMLQMTTVLMTVWLFIWKCWSCCWRRRVKYYFTVLFVCFHVNIQGGPIQTAPFILLLISRRGAVFIGPTCMSISMYPTFSLLENDKLRDRYLIMSASLSHRANDL